MREGRIGPRARRQEPEAVENDSGDTIIVTPPTIWLYYCPAFYWTYRQKVKTSTNCVYLSTVKRNLQILRPHFLDLKFAGSYPIKVINFLTEFANTADDLKISETEACLAINKVINPPAATQYRVAVAVPCLTGHRLPPIF